MDEIRRWSVLIFLQGDHLQITSDIEILTPLKYESFLSNEGKKLYATICQMHDIASSQNSLRRINIL